MKTRTQLAVLLLGLAALTLAGCRRNIVRAAPPSVATRPPAETARRPAASSPAPIAAPELPQPAPELVLLPAPQPEPPRPQPVPAEAESGPPSTRAAEVAPPQISPILSRADQERLMRLTTDGVRIAERNLQLAGGQRLNAAQDDLVEKVRGFLAQAHEAIRANDWVRAQNLAEKAQVLSTDLVRSF